jgi:hypothetical protein
LLVRAFFFCASAASLGNAAAADPHSGCGWPVVLWPCEVDCIAGEWPELALAPGGIAG